MGVHLRVRQALQKTKRRPFQSTREEIVLNSLDFARRLRLRNVLEKHQGCVNTVHWDADTGFLLSGSDDRTVVIWKVDTDEQAVVLEQFPTVHQHNIFDAQLSMWHNCIVGVLNPKMVLKKNSRKICEKGLL